MENNKSKHNKLIIKKNLMKEIKKAGIPKIVPQAIDLLILESEKFIKETLLKAKENMDINARKTMKKEDIAESIKKPQKDFDL